MLNRIKVNSVVELEEQGFKIIDEDIKAVENALDKGIELYANTDDMRLYSEIDIYTADMVVRDED